MAITFVGAASAASNTVSLPAGWQPGDYALVLAGEHGAGATAAIVTPAGWTEWANSLSSGFRAGALGGRYLQSGDTTVGTWTNADRIGVVVYRGVHPDWPLDGTSGIGSSFNNSTPTIASSATSLYSSLAVRMLLTQNEVDAHTNYADDSPLWTSRTSGLALEYFGACDAAVGTSGGNATLSASSSHFSGEFQLRPATTFAQVVDSDSQTGTVTGNSSSWTLTYPTNLQAGDLILVVMSVDGTMGISDTPTFPSGFVIGTYSATANHGFAWAKKLSDGTETGTFSVTLTASEQGAWRCMRIVGWEGTLGTTFGNASSSGAVAAIGSAGTSSTPLSQPLDPDQWDVEDTLWFSFAGIDTSRTVSDWPDDTVDNGSLVSGGSNGATLAWARRELGASSWTPTSFTVSSSDEWKAVTIAIRPAQQTGTQYSQGLTASLSFTGDSIKRANRTLSASQSFSGAVLKEPRRALAGSLSFTGAALKQAARALTGAVSFTGNVSGIRLIERLFTATLSFTGGGIKQTSRALGGGLSFSGSTLKNTARSLTASVSFAGAANRAVSRALSGAASFAGSISKSTTRSLTGGLSPSALLSTSLVITRAFTATLGLAGALTKHTSRSLSGALSSAGVLSRSTLRSLAGSITPSGAISLLKVFERAFTASLSFTSAQARGTGKALTATLSPTTTFVREATRTVVSSPATVTFSGSLNTIRVFLRALTATLTLDGTLTKQTSRAWAAVLDFTGNLASQFQGGSQQFFEAFNAALSFSGGVTKRTSRSIAASLSSDGVVARSTSHALTASVSFTATTAKSVTRVLTGSVSFTGAVTTLKVFVRALTASLSFSGNLSRQAGKNLTAALSSAGALIKSTSRPIAASLTPSASLTRSVARALAAGLSFSGALLSNSVVIRAFTASLSFAGNITRATTYARALDAALSFSGTVVRSTARALGAAVAFEGQVSRSTSKALTGALSTSGSLSRSVARSLVAGLSFAGGIASQVFTGGQRILSAVGTVSVQIAGRASVALASGVSTSVQVAGKAAAAIRSSFTIKE